jgi:hypothetical protein
MLWCLLLALPSLAGASDPQPRDDGYRGIWFTLGQYTDSPYGKGDWEAFWPYGDKYSGGLGTYTAKHVPIAVYAPEARKTFFCYGGSRRGERYLYNMVSYYDHETDRVPRPVIVHDKGGVDDPHDNSSLAIDSSGHLWVYVAGRARSRPGFVYRSVRPYDIDGFERVSSDEICYPQPWAVGGGDIVELFTRYTGVRELYWNLRRPDGGRGEDRKLAGMEGHYQVSFRRGDRIVTAFNRHPGGHPDRRTDLYYLETRDRGASWQTVDGKTVETPVVNPASSALVRAYSREGRLVYLNDVTLDGNGRPVILVVTSSDHRPGPQGDPRTWEVLHHTGDAWQRHRVTTSTHNYDTGPLWVEPDGPWRVVGPTETGPQRWGGGGEIAAWISRDRGATWAKSRDVTRDSPRNHSYVRKVVGAEPGSPFAVFWADGHADDLSVSRLYFADREGREVRRLPYDMDGDHAVPEILEGDAQDH